LTSGLSGVGAGCSGAGSGCEGCADNKIKAISEYCLSCGKIPTENYLLKINALISKDTYRTVWWNFPELSDLSANMCMYPWFPNLGYKEHAKQINKGKRLCGIN
jgi:hypothetical protein